MFSFESGGGGAVRGGVAGAQSRGSRQHAAAGPGLSGHRRVGGGRELGILWDSPNYPSLSPGSPAHGATVIFLTDRYPLCATLGILLNRLNTYC